MPKRRALLALVAVLAVLGLAAVAVGIGMRTVWLPDDEVTASVDLSGAGPVVVTAPGVPEMMEGPVLVTATAAEGGTVLLARGREEDVTAWVGGAQHTVITGLDTSTTFSTETVEGEPTVPDPASSPLWQQRVSDPASASMLWDPPQGRWLLLAAGDGTAAAAQELTMTWPREVSAPWSVPFIVLGVLLLLVAVVLTVSLSRGRATRTSDVPPRRAAAHRDRPLVQELDDLEEERTP